MNTPLSVTAYLCLGSNIQPEANICFAVQRLQRDFGDIKTSNLYLSQAVGFDGDDFLNLAVSIITVFSLEKLLHYTDTLEQEAGRVRVRRGRFDSRTLDVDIVMFGDLKGQHGGREWPSPDLGENAHMLLPLSEIASDKKHPSTGIEFQQLWAEFDQAAQPLTQVKPLW